MHSSHADVLLNVDAVSVYTVRSSTPRQLGATGYSSTELETEVNWLVARSLAWAGVLVAGS